MTFGGDLGFDPIPWDDPATDYRVVTEFETHLSSCLICDDVDLVHDIECVYAQEILDPMKSLKLKIPKATGLPPDIPEPG